MIARLGKLATSCKVSVHHMVTMFTHYLKSTQRSILKGLKTLTGLVSLQALNSLLVTVDEDSGQVLSVVRNYRQADPLRRKRQYFTHFKFLPGFGFYGFGLLHTIGGLSRAATSILRQLIDAGTLSNLPAGFKARGVRIRNDDEPLAPGEFRDIDAPGGDLRNALMPLPYQGTFWDIANYWALSSIQEDDLPKSPTQRSRTLTHKLPSEPQLH